VASRKDVASRRITRTGPSHGPGIRTTNSSPWRSEPSAPRVLRNTAISGDAWFSLAATTSISAAGLIELCTIRTAYERCSMGPAPWSSRWRPAPSASSSATGSGRSARLPVSSERCMGVVRHM
jgi:hypothetical protein